MSFLNRYHKHLLLIFLIGIIFFVPRYVAHTKYDILEDEILAIHNNRIYSIEKLIFAPDFTHPGLWYILMEIPTQLLDINHGIVYYRLIQMSLLFVLIIGSIYYFRKKIPKLFLTVFLSLFLSNAYVVHLTMQHRMYALVIGIAIFYSLCWYRLISNQENVTLAYRKFTLLGLIAALGFLVNYSIIWLIPVWPIAYLLHQKKLSYAIKQIFVFFVSFFLSISWFIPTFIQNSSISVEVNQWAQTLNMHNVLEMLGNLIGLFPMAGELDKLNVLVLPTLATFFLVAFIKIIRDRDVLLIASLLAGLIGFGAFIVVAHLTGNSLLYARTAITLVILMYVILAHAYQSNSKLVKYLIVAIIFVQLSQFFIYFRVSQVPWDRYLLFNYYQHPMAYFSNYEFKNNSCMIPIPDWNELSLRYFFGQKVEVIPIYGIDSNELSKRIQNCSDVYVMDQLTVERNREAIKGDYYTITHAGLKPTLLHTYANQALFILK